MRNFSPHLFMLIRNCDPVSIAAEIKTAIHRPFFREPSEFHDGMMQHKTHLNNYIKCVYSTSYFQPSNQFRPIWFNLKFRRDKFNYNRFIRVRCQVNVKLLNSLYSSVLIYSENMQNERCSRSGKPWNQRLW